jgi:arginase
MTGIEKAPSRRTAAAPQGGGQRWMAVGSPFDCSASGRGEQSAPAALRRAGLLRRLGIPDSGDAHGPFTSATRDPRSGIPAHDQILSSSRLIHDSVRAVYEQNHLPLVLGGDCGCLLGSIAAAVDRYGVLSLVLADGHADYMDGTTSDTGEIADMSTAIVGGHGPSDLVGLAGRAPMVQPRHTLLLGYRDEPDVPAGDPQERDFVPADTEIISGLRLREPATVPLVQDALARFAAETSGVWLHIDVDVLDQTVMPAVTYPKPDGPDFGQLAAALRPVATSPLLVGISLADLRPDLDQDGSITARVCDFVAEMLTPGSAS